MIRKAEFDVLAIGVLASGGRLFQRARAAGLSTSLDTNDGPGEHWNGEPFELLRHANILFPNRRGAAVGGAEMFRGTDSRQWLNEIAQTDGRQINAEERR